MYNFYQLSHRMLTVYSIDIKTHRKVQQPKQTIDLCKNACLKSTYEYKPYLNLKSAPNWILMINYGSITYTVQFPLL